MSVCVFSPVILGEKGPYTHTLTSSHQLFFDVFCIFWSKTRCLSAKLDTLTSKQIGVCPKFVVSLPVTKPFFCRFLRPKTHTLIHTLQFTNRFLDPNFLRIANCRVCMSVCVFGVWVHGCVSRGLGGYPCHPQKTVFWPLSKTHAESGFWEPFRASFWIPAPKGPF